ncbi:uncharacterized protein DUF4374 [Arcticibacter pallidicorallinus]|uniref:Uncharacterized protein DUF4374 n=1 Tax=Arcticibacter pallidicorallinus TaxID=1259464 RepID=A0A2T0UB98_9SPHI|nr:DUF4374 domain-containing protein [Arcticibacter pallidicorallinus]PRY55215.1 uncharacterized protein DUF4374 [Arcticibacter pallidicorallinus]
MKTSYLHLLVAFFVFSLFTACDPELEYLNVDDTDTELTGVTKYIISATPIGTTGIADYLLTANSLKEGVITTQGNGLEQDGSYRYYITHKNRFFSMLYGQGNPGAVTSYRLDSTGTLTKLSNFQSETVQVFAPVMDDVLTIKVPRSGNEFASMFRVDARKYQIVGEKQVNIVQLAGNGERAHFTWATQVGDKLFLPYMSIKGKAPDAFGTAYPDSSWVAVFSYPELELEKVIKDNRTSYIGAYFNNGLVETENGDAYAFSPAAATNNNVPTSTKPSAIIRILKGTNEFDQSYFFNVEQESGGHHIAAQSYLGNGIFILQMYPKPKSLEGVARKFAIADVINKKFKWVTGLPEDITKTTTINNYSPGDGRTGYIGITTASEGSYVYIFDAEIGAAKRGLKVEGGTITAINALKY